MSLDQRITTCLNGKTERFPERAIALMAESAAALKAAREALPDASKLEVLAKWLDIRFPDDDVEVQLDLRRWAKQARTALALLEK